MDTEKFDFHPRIWEDDFDAMREHYIQYLAYHHMSPADISKLLNDFDIAHEDKDYDCVRRWMAGIGIILVKEQF